MDDIAAFGVLLMELVANEEASWDKDDVEYGLDGQSNSVRLARILEQWEEDLSDGYRRVGRACLKFESLVATFDDDEIGSDLKCFAIIYKFIVDPLFRCLLHEFGETYELFHGIRGPWCPLSAAVDLSPRRTAKLVLFDDLETKDKEK
jgi:hypothetical protein